MRGLSRKHIHEEEAESAFVSMTDMTVSFLFIVILLLAFFASKFSSEDNVPRTFYDRVVSERDNARSERDAALEERDLLEIKLEQTQAKLARATSELQAALAELAKLRKTVAEQDKRIDDLEVIKKELEAEVASLKRTILRLERRIAELEAIVSEENPLEQYSFAAASVRRQMLERLAQVVQEDIETQKIEGLTVTAQGDALRFQGSGLFASGARSLTGRSLQVVRLLGEHLDRELPCYSVGRRSTISKECNPDLVLFETIQVEGHTDSKGGNTYNLKLSAGRALSAFTAIAPDQEQLGSDMLKYQNLLGQPLLAFAGYGEMRPIVDEAARDRSANRRIDLRFIMYVPPGVEFIPETVEDLEKVSDLLRKRASEK